MDSSQIVRFIGRFLSNSCPKVEFVFNRSQSPSPCLSTLFRSQHSMNKKLSSRLLIVPAFALLLVSCVAEKDFDNSKFESVPPDNVTPESAENPVPVGEHYSAKFETSKGDVLIDVHPEWAPRGAARFKELIEAGVFDEARFFRVLPNFMAQVGIAADPKVSAKWSSNNIPDDPVKKSNTRGMVSFATSGPNSRSSQIFISTGDNDFLDSQGFSPFATVTKGMDVVDSLYSEYGEGAPQGSGPEQGRVQKEGNAYLNKEFPKLDYIKKATIIPHSQTHHAESEKPEAAETPKEEE